MGPSPARFRDLSELEITYEGSAGQILRDFVLPVVEVAERYDRLTSFFNVGALLAISEGLEQLRRRSGQMRLVLGIHDVPAELAEARIKSEMWAASVVREVRERLLSEASTLTDELHRDRLATLAWMIRDGFLQVRVAVPRRADGTAAATIFHSKRLLFHDSVGDVITASGSPNETVPGLEGNYEELTVHMSWRDSSDYVRRHVESFQKLWDDGRDDVYVRDLDPSFASELLHRIDRPLRPAYEAAVEDTAAAILHESARSPAFWALNSGPVALYPHQERAVLDALSRWPVRVLLADEVGLGKTLESGAVISYLLRFTDVQEAMILAPAAVLRQWRDELLHHFGLEFWLYDSTSRSYESPSGQTISVGADGPLSESRPARTLVSAQLARGTRRRGHIFEKADRLPDLLLVDEAHAARVRLDIEGHRHPTLLWRMLNDVKERIAHMVLVTATPMQLEAGEYHAMLELLGLPTLWEDLGEYKRSLELLATGPQRDPSLQHARTALDLIAASVRTYGWRPDDVSDAQRKLLDDLLQEDTISARATVRAKESWEQTYEMLVKLHPAHLLTIRNSRHTLEGLGHRFPERDLQAPHLDVPLDIRDLYSVIQDYLDDAYGEVEAALDPDGKHGLGFAKSTYYQRLASSLHACRISLHNRLNKIESIEAGETTSLPLEDEGVEDEREVAAAGPNTDWDQLARAASIERTYIRGLLDQLDRIERTTAGIADPKVRELISILRRYQGQDAVLVFSRYTDTLQGCLRAFRVAFERELPGHALYTGGEVWIDLGNGPHQADKQGVKDALDDGLVEVVFCSEAASEGLNLQTARVMVNVDVPWNPARLEQRIGRIARLGQQADEVTIYNLWFPDSVEAKMYSRLMARRDLYELAVGQFPEIISQAIRDALSSHYDLDQTFAQDPLEELQRLREETQHRAIQRVWDAQREPVPGSEGLRTDIYELVADILAGQGNQAPSPTRATLEAGSRRPLWLAHPLLDVLVGTSYEDVSGSVVDLEVVDIDGRPSSFAVRHDGGRWVLGATELGLILAGALRLRPLRIGTAERVDMQAGESSLAATVARLNRWLPDQGELTTVVDPAPAPPSGKISCRRIGTILIDEGAS